MSPSWTQKERGSVSCGMYCPEQSEAHEVEHSSIASEAGLIKEETFFVKLVLSAIALGSEIPFGKVGPPTVTIE